MYLSRLILDIRHRQVRRDLGDAYQFHRTVLRAFPQAPSSAQPREFFGLLYRAEPLAGALSQVRLLVQSNAMPNWSFLPDGYLGLAPDARGNPAVRSVAEEYAQIETGMRLIFRLRANPTKRLSDRTPGRENALLGKRVALLREEEQLGWLARQAERHGFRLLSTDIEPAVLAVQVAAQATERGHRPDATRGKGHPLTFGAVQFSGRLEVNDAGVFRAALAHGIGTGKAFGFGLLSIASI